MHCLLCRRRVDGTQRFRFHGRVSATGSSRLFMPRCPPITRGRMCGVITSMACGGITRPLPSKPSVAAHNNSLCQQFVQPDPWIQRMNCLHCSIVDHGRSDDHWADPLMQMGNMLPYAGPAPAVVHLHGGEVPSAFDGGPDAWFTHSGIYGPGLFPICLRIPIPRRPRRSGSMTTPSAPPA